MVRDQDGYILSTGRRFYANHGILGLSPEGDIHEGHDGSVFDALFTPEERREIADHMIERWGAWAVAPAKVEFDAGWDEQP